MSQKKNTIYYGWFIVLAFFLIWIATQGIYQHSFTAFIEPLANKFGWNYTQVTFAASLRASLYMLFTPIAGAIIDRWSARKLVFLGIVLVSIGIFLLSRINTLGQFYLCFILVGIGGSTCTMTVPLTVVGRWFRKKLSLATGIAMSAAGFGGLVVPLVTHLIDTAGWRAAMSIIGLTLLVAISPLSLIIRQNPEQYGYLPDGDVNDKSVSDTVPNAIKDSTEDIGIKQILKSRPFWQISLAFTLLLFTPIGVQIHAMPYLSTIGVERTTSSFITSALLISGSFGRLLFGWLGDRFDRRRVAASGTTLMGISLLLFIYTTTDTTWLVMPAIIFCGIGWGTVVMHPVLLRQYFNTSKLGFIIGFSIGITMIAFIVSPPLISWIFEMFGNYRVSWFVLIGIVIISVIGQLTNPSSNITMRKIS